MGDSVDQHNGSSAEHTAFSGIMLMILVVRLHVNLFLDKQINDFDGLCLFFFSKLNAYF